MIFAYVRPPFSSLQNNIKFRQRGDYLDNHCCQFAETLSYELLAEFRKDLDYD